MTRTASRSTNSDPDDRDSADRRASPDTGSEDRGNFVGDRDTENPVAGHDGVAAAPGPAKLTDPWGKIPEGADSPHLLPFGTIYGAPDGRFGVIGVARNDDRPLEHADFNLALELSGKVRQETAHR